MKTKLRLRKKVYKRLVHELTTNEINFIERFDNYFIINMLLYSKNKGITSIKMNKNLRK